MLSYCGCMKPPLCVIIAVTTTMVSLAADSGNRFEGSSEDYLITWSKDEPSGDANGFLYISTFVIINKSTGNKVEAVLKKPGPPKEEATVRYHFVSRERLVIETYLTERPMPTHSLSVVDPKTGDTIDTIVTLSPSFSPSRRYCVYRVFSYPRNDPRGSSSLILCYDFQQSPQANRMGKPDPTLDDQSVGWALYPEPFAERKEYILPELVTNPTLGWGLCSPLLWSEDSQSVVFLCQESDQVTDLVQVDLRDGPRSSRIKKRSLLSETEAIKPFCSAPEDPKELATWNPAIFADELHWVDKGSVRLVLNPAYAAGGPNCPREFTVEIP